MRPEFTTLATALLRRLSVLAEAHCGVRPEVNAREILASAGQVRVESSDLRWHDWERYSARQDAPMALGGFVGRVTFAGELAPWWPVLKLGEVLHVGKGTSFGLGKYTALGAEAGADAGRVDIAMGGQAGEIVDGVATRDARTGPSQRKAGGDA